MRIWNFLIIYSCLTDAGKKALDDENHTAVDEDLEEKKSVFLTDILPKKEYKVIEKKDHSSIDKVTVGTHLRNGAGGSDHNLLSCKNHLTQERETQLEAGRNFVRSILKGSPR